jgi:Mg-chelatase subunit ChlD
VIAAVRHAKEYRLWDFDANAPEPRLRERLNFNGCTGPGQFLQNDVLTLNHRRYPTPTTTPTSCPTPSPTEPATVAPTWTTTPTATVPASATHSPTQTSTIAPTATRMPHPAYLPIALRERCTPDKQRVDAALVIDASSSMLDHTATGRTKLAAAIEAAGTFLHQLQMVAGDQAAIVAFNADAWLLQPLTSDRYALDAALASIEPALQTCLVCGVDVAANELASDRRDPDNTPVMIVLTDGLSNPLPASDAVVRAEDAKRSGVVIYTIGLGDELDFDALEQIASGPESFYRAPDAEQLADIYRQIAVEIPCPAESFWGGR